MNSDQRRHFRRKWGHDPRSHYGKRIVAACRDGYLAGVTEEKRRWVKRSITVLSALIALTAGGIALALTGCAAKQPPKPAIVVCPPEYQRFTPKDDCELRGTVWFCKPGFECLALKVIDDVA